ncbi:hypothetical protein F2Q69_00059591 [Brassica cretica]|uniref:Uncharacterized protein n=1 Tax=Brassica cretica TaxID=69181 RepID=A0A8S9RNR4_BRACR|nr:hypothetical protein F2Q69_00059591 [Brassica cretica]
MFSRCVMSQFVRFLSGLSISSVVIVRCTRSCCVDIGVMLGFVCQFLAVLIVLEMCQFKQLAWNLGAIYIRVVPVMCGGVELFRDSSEMELSLCDVILGTDWLS